MKCSIVCALFLTICSFNAVSAETWTNGKQLISNIIWRPSHHGFYVKPETYHDPQTCASSNIASLYVFHPEIEADEPNMNKLFALISLAMASNKTIYVLVDGCRGNLPLIKGIQVNN